MANGLMNGLAGDHAGLAAPKVVRAKPKRRKTARRAAGAPPAGAPAPELAPVERASKSIGALSFILNHWKQLCGVVATAAATGWIMLPAKQVDVDALREGLKQTTIQVQAIGAELRGLRQEMGVQNAHTQEMIRTLVQSTLQASAPAPTAPSRPARRPVVKTEAKPVEAGGFLGGLIPK